MEPFPRLEAAAVPFPRPNIDTDQIFPARFLQKPRGPDFGRYLFHDLRFRPDGSEEPDFVLNQPAFRDARIIVAERNFACGSSRENAVWALYDFGIRAALAPSFGDIFYSNSLKNGFLPIALPPEVIAAEIARLEARPGERIGVSLEEQTVVLSDGSTHRFEIGEFARHCLLNGLDELAYTLSRLDEIAAFEARTGRATE
jgi:3-isopropylmalate/(R)-2-methylmalate dehydratase small subunit